MNTHDRTQTPPPIKTIACVNPRCELYGQAEQGNLTVRKTYGKDGIRWFDPGGKRSQNGVRIDRENPNSFLPSQQVDHVVVISNGRIIGRSGKPLPPGAALRDYPLEGHIPLSEYIQWREWNHP